MTGAPLADRLEALEESGRASFARFAHTRDRGDLDRAVDTFRAGCDLVPDDDAKCTCLANLGAALAMRAQNRPDPDADLNEAIASIQRALATPSLTEARRAGVSENLISALLFRCRLLMDRYASDNESRDGEEALEAAGDAIDLLTSGNPRFPEALSTRARARQLLFDRRSRPEDLDLAVEDQKRAVELSQPATPEAAARLTALGDLHWGRASMHFDDPVRTIADRELAPAIDAYEAALKVPGLEHRERLVARYGLARAHLSCHDLDDRHEGPTRSQPTGASGPRSRLLGRLSRRKPDHLDRAIELFTLSLRGTEGELRAIVLESLGNALRARSEMFGAKNVEQALSDLDRAIEGFREAAESITGFHLPLHHYNLAEALRVRHGISDRPEDLAAAFDAYEKSCRGALASTPVWTLRSGRAWGNWALDLNRWSDARKGLGYALEGAEALHRAQLTRRAKEVWLGVGWGVAEAAGYAAAREGASGEAVVILERSRARLFAEALELDRAALEGLDASGAGELAATYRRIAQDIAGLEQVTERVAAGEASAVSNPVGTLETRRRELEGVINEIRSVPGFEWFLERATLAEPHKADPSAPLVYVSAVRCGGFALMVRGEETAEVVWLPELALDRVGARGSDYFQAYNGRRGDPERWRSAIDEVADWLWEAAMGPLIRALAPAREAVVVPCGPLGLLPLHAAWTDDPSKPTGRRYALDDLLIRYAPNARMAAASRAAAGRIPPDSVLAIEDPQPVTAEPLPHAKAEVEAVLATFSDRQHLEPADSTWESVIEALPRHSVLHFACHGSANTNEPLETGLVLAQDRRLTLRDLLDPARRRSTARLAVLSACETGLIGTKLPDEVIGLPAGLLQAGVAGVVASLWAVPDVTTRALMTRFYDLWRAERVEKRLDPPEALRTAQQELRDRSEGIGDLDEVRDVDVSHPYYWAAFTYVGA